MPYFLNSTATVYALLCGPPNLLSKKQFKTFIGFTVYAGAVRSCEDHCCGACAALSRTVRLLYAAARAKKNQKYVRCIPPLYKKDIWIKLQRRAPPQYRTSILLRFSSMRFPFFRLSCTCRNRNIEKRKTPIRPVSANKLGNKPLICAISPCRLSTVTAYQTPFQRSDFSFQGPGPLWSCSVYGCWRDRSHRYRI